MQVPTIGFSFIDGYRNKLIMAKKEIIQVMRRCTKCMKGKGK
jgi:hypothetical protein